jgi:hypothetical protein
MEFRVFGEQTFADDFTAALFVLGRDEMIEVVPGARAPLVRSAGAPIPRFLRIQG